MGHDWPEGFSERPLLTRLDGKVAHFKDGSSEEVDAIILCTGYLHHFPFLPDELRLQTNNRMYPDNLYKGVVFQDQPALMYLGMQDQYFTFNMFDAQAWYVRDLILGRIPMPDAQTRAADISRWRELEARLETPDDDIDFQAEYIRDLLAVTDYPHFDLDAQGALFKRWLEDKRRDIMGYRNQCYRSVLTGSKAPPLARPWMEIMDDSLSRSAAAWTTPSPARA